MQEAVSVFIVPLLVVYPDGVLCSVVVDDIVLILQRMQHGGRLVVGNALVVSFDGLPGGQAVGYSCLNGFIGGDEERVAVVVEELHVLVDTTAIACRAGLVDEGVILVEQALLVLRSCRRGNETAIFHNLILADGQFIELLELVVGRGVFVQDTIDAYAGGDDRTVVENEGRTVGEGALVCQRNLDVGGSRCSCGDAPALILELEATLDADDLTACIAGDLDSGTVLGNVVFVFAVDGVGAVVHDGVAFEHVLQTVKDLVLRNVFCTGIGISLSTGGEVEPIQLLLNGELTRTRVG